MSQSPAYNVTLRYGDGEEQALSVPHGSTVLDAAIAADLAVLYQCQSGSCTSCHARLASGQAPMRSDGASALMKSEQDAGERLLCLTRPESDCSFDLSYNKSIAGGAAKVNAFVNAIEHIAPDAVRLSLELADGDWIDFQPGQFVQVKVPGTQAERRYSMSSAPSEMPKVELLIRLLDGGVMSDYLRGPAAVDDVIELEGPFGSFFLSGKPKGKVIMIAGGTGLAPMMSMIDVLRERPGKKPNVLLSFGCASEETLFHRDVLDLRQMWMPSLEVRYSVDKDCETPGILTGNPVSAITQEDVVGEDTQAYLCGPPGMIQAARTHLESLGVASSNIYAEQFVASE